MGHQRPPGLEEPRPVGVHRQGRVAADERVDLPDTEGSGGVDHLAQVTDGDLGLGPVRRQGLG